MADGKYQPLAGQGILILRAMDDRAGEPPAREVQPLQPVPEAHLSAEGDDLAADVLHDVYQNIRADMRLRVVDDALRRAVRGKLAQHPAHSPILRAGVELSVRKGSRAALAELHVALRLQLPARAQRVHRFLAADRVHAALKHDRPRSGLCQHKRRKHARGAEADDDRSLLRRGDMRDIIHRLRIFAHVCALCVGDRFLLITMKRRRHGTDIVNVALLPRVKRTLHELQLFYFPLRNT